jgi:hypothetical protein
MATNFHLVETMKTAVPPSFSSYTGDVTYDGLLHLLRCHYNYPQSYAETDSVQGINADRGRTHGDWSSTAGETQQRELKKSTRVALLTSEGTLVPAGRKRSDL